MMIAFGILAAVNVVYVVKPSVVSVTPEGLLYLDSLTRRRYFSQWSNIERIAVEMPLENIPMRGSRANRQFLKFVKFAGRRRKRSHNLLRVQRRARCSSPDVRPVNCLPQNVGNDFRRLALELDSYRAAAQADISSKSAHELRI